jgi:hypothetical protein
LPNEGLRRDVVLGRVRSAAAELERGPDARPDRHGARLRSLVGCVALIESEAYPTDSKTQGELEECLEQLAARCVLWLERLEQRAKG